MASVVPRVQISSALSAIPKSAATFSRAASNASVARTESECTPRCTLALSRS
jgi:hypothetical protein